MCADVLLKVDPWKAAATGLRLKGRLAERLQRLESTVQAVLAEPEVDLVFEPGGAARVTGPRAAGEDTRVRVSGEVLVRLRLQCQRCLEEFDCLHRAGVEVQVAAQGDPDSADDVLTCEPGHALDVTALVEDELLLSLPFSARCGREGCVPGLGEPLGEPLARAAADAASDAAAAHGRPNPFAVLAALKRNGSADERIPGQGEESGSPPAADEKE